MRKTVLVRFLFLSFAGIFCVGSVAFAHVRGHGESCQELLGGEALVGPASANGFRAVEVKAEVSDSAADVRLKSLIERVENLVDDALLAGVLKNKEVKHLLEDLEELKGKKNPKVGQESFEWMMGEWAKFIDVTERQLSAFKKMDSAEQKRWKSKMELPVYFATGHFIVFLETRNKDFDYSKMTALLKAMNSEGARVTGGALGSEKLFMYLFEKQVFRFFSTREFRNCKA